jgi:pyridoxamine 5'-phosphate oxidase
MMPHIVESEPMLGDRSDYTRGKLEREDLDPNPMIQLQSWLNFAIEAGVPEPSAMCLSTSTLEGAPSGRMVLLRGADERGVVFYTNYESRKAIELEANPRCAATLWWPQLERQIRIEGRAEKVEAEISDAYFRGRPRDSRLASAASPQSRVVSSRQELLDLVAGLGEDVSRPEHWGGYRIVPDMFEFWQGGTARLHDRFRYRRDGDDWIIERLAP